MRSIGIRELRQHASKYLRLVRAGQRLQITDRGHVIALLVPAATSGGLDALIEAGRAEPAEGDLLELGPPLRPRKGAPLPSRVLAAARESER